MKRLFVATLLIFAMVTASLWAATLRINGDNSWVGFVNGEQVAEGNNWQEASVTEFDMPDGYAVIAVYVHDAEPGAAGRGGALFDVILDDGTYIPSDDTWKATQVRYSPTGTMDGNNPILTIADGITPRNWTRSARASGASGQIRCAKS